MIVAPWRNPEGHSNRMQGDGEETQLDNDLQAPLSIPAMVSEIQQHEKRGKHPFMPPAFFSPYVGMMVPSEVKDRRQDQ